MPSVSASWLIRSHCSRVRRTVISTRSPLALVRSAAMPSPCPSSDVSRLLVKAASPVFLTAMLPSDVLVNPCPECGDFLGGFALGVKFRDGAADGHRPGKGAAVADRHGCEGKIIRFKNVSGFPHLRRTCGAGVHDEGGGLFRCLGHPHG